MFYRPAVMRERWRCKIECLNQKLIKREDIIKSKGHYNQTTLNDSNDN